MPHNAGLVLGALIKTVCCLLSWCSWPAWYSSCWFSGSL